MKIYYHSKNILIEFLNYFDNCLKFIHFTTQNSESIR